MVWSLAKRLHTVVETPEFASRANGLMTRVERTAFINHIAANPAAGDRMPGTGGARKVRWGVAGRGKRGSVRVITFYSGPPVPVFLLAIFGKNEKSNLSKSEANALKKVLGDIVAEYKTGHRRR